jgi:hypothetical protein
LLDDRTKKRDEMKRSVPPTKRMRGCSGERKHKEKNKISKQEFLGQIKAILVDGTDLQVSVHRKGKSVFLDNLPVHPSNMGRGYQGKSK